MLLNKRHKKALQIFWIVVSVIVIAGMILLYFPAIRSLR
jgi:predicted nucleic acid-binding Zn ribbon protein